MYAPSRKERCVRVSYQSVSKYPSTGLARRTRRLSAATSVARIGMIRSRRAMRTTLVAWGNGGKSGRVVTGEQDDKKQMANAKCGMQNRRGGLRAFRIPHLAFRIAISAPAPPRGPRA